MDLAPGIAFFVMLEKWKKAVDSKNVFGALLIGLSKAFDCLRHGLIIPKPNAYRFILPALNLIQNYLGNRKERTKVNDSYDPRSDIKIASYAHDNTRHDSFNTVE